MKHYILNCNIKKLEKKNNLTELAQHQYWKENIIVINI